MLARRFLPALIVLFWIAGINHCVLEQLLTRADCSTSECPVHSTADPNSHREGEPCGVKQVNPTRVSAELPSAVVFLNIIGPTSIELPSPLPVRPSFLNIAEYPNQQFFNPLTALSIASNAPPVVA